MSFPFEYKVTVLVTIILLLVGITGIYAYLRFSEVISDVKKDTPKSILLITESLQNDLTKAENNVKSFSLTADTNLLSQFYVNAENATEKLIDLQDKQKGKEFRKNIDSLEYLVNEKLDILNDLLLLQDQFRVQEALDKVAKKIEEAAVKIKENKKPDEESISRKKKKRKFLGWLFKKKSKKEEQKVNPKDEVTIEDVNKEVSEVKEEEEGIERELKAVELALITADREASLKVYNLLEELKTIELQKLDEEKEKIEHNITDTNRQLILFCIALGLLIVFMAFIVISYAKNNRRYRKALNQAKQKAEELAKTKERFLANVSHEIRTPMNAIAGFTEQIAEGPLTSSQEESLRIVQRSTDHLTKLVNDILDFTKLENAKLKLDQHTFHLPKLIEELITFINPLLKSDAVKLNFEIRKEVPEYIEGDEFRLRQILLNLLSNAVKFTEQGQISLTISANKKEGNQYLINFTIEDSGIGMNQSQLSRVYKEFEQAENSTARNFGGTGLGLSITKMLVELHNGKIKIDSKYEQGTTVNVKIPFRRSKRDAIKSENKEKHQKGILKGKKVLIVDDELYNRALLIKILEKHGASASEAEDGEKAIKMITRNTFDLVLMDARMPNMNGLEATQKIRALTDKKKKLVPIISLSAAILDEDKINYIKAGMNDFLPKPIKTHQLLAVISRVLDLKKQVKQQIEENSKDSKFDKIDLSELEQHAQGDKRFIIEMLETFLSSTSKEVESIEQAVAKQNWTEAANHAHKITPQCKHLAAFELHRLLKQIEYQCRNQKDLDQIESLLEAIRQESVMVLNEVKKSLQLYHNN